MNYQKCGGAVKSAAAHVHIVETRRMICHVKYRDKYPWWRTVKTKRLLQCPECFAWYKGRARSLNLPLHKYGSAPWERLRLLIC